MNNPHLENNHLPSEMFSYAYTTHKRISWFSILQETGDAESFEHMTDLRRRVAQVQQPLIPGQSGFFGSLNDALVFPVFWNFCFFT